MTQNLIPLDVLQPANGHGTTRCHYTPSERRADGKYVAHDIIPHLCHIEVTYACNENCSFCYNPPGEDKLGDLDLVDRMVHSIAENQIPHVYLIGGEPSLLGTERLNGYIELLAEHSSVTIVTNGRKRLKGISPKLACFGVSLHGANAETHDFLKRTKNGFAETTETIRYYVSEGFDVRCVVCLTGYNYDQMYDLIALAAELGMESVYVDRYEDGGIGAVHSHEYDLRPTMEQFQIAVGQIIQARRDFHIFRGRVGFGTAIPYCLDERILEEGIQSNCGVGTYFCAINPYGEFRMCNQSQLVFGNVLEESLETIWNKPDLDIFRDLSWVDEPCASCELLLECTGGCKVDVNCSQKFCVDYAVRGLSRPASEIMDKVNYRQLAEKHPVNWRVFRPNRYMKLITKYEDKFLVTRYQTVKLDAMALEMARAIHQNAIVNERDLVGRFSDRVDEHDVRLFLSQLIQVNAVDPIGEVPYAD